MIYFYCFLVVWLFLVGIASARNTTSRLLIKLPAYIVSVYFAIEVYQMLNQ